MSNKSLSGQWCVHVVQWWQHIYHFNLLNCRKKNHFDNHQTMSTISECCQHCSNILFAGNTMWNNFMFRIAYYWYTISAENTFHTVHSMNNEYCKETCILWQLLYVISKTEKYGRRSGVHSSFHGPRIAQRPSDWHVITVHFVLHHV